MPAVEHTIRNKSTRPILTLRPATLQRLLEASPEASSLVLSKFKKIYKTLTGKDITLDHEQQLAFLKRYGADSQGMWASEFSKLPLPWYMIERCFRDGFLQAGSSAGFLDDLEVAAPFYELLRSKLVPNA